MTTAYIVHPSCRLHNMGPYHPECPDRLGAVSDQMISSGLDAHVTHYEAPPVTQEQLARVHDADYIAMIEAASPESGICYLDPDTAMNAHSLSAAQHAAGAVVLGTELVLRGEAKTAFCAVRPPGHHAERRRAMGFCLFNSVAVGVAHALAQGVKRAAVIDFDVHHGNGTEQIFAAEPRVVMVGTFEYPLYPYSGVEPAGPNMHNVPLAAGSGGDEFRAAMTETCLPALEAHRPEILFISAGFDAHHEDPLANLRLTEADYAWITEELVALAARHAKGRIVSSLEGGYALSALGRSAVAHIKALAEI
ncbi:MAG TPA: histone deacetylase family protein [Casimicrobiaceae bacterium]|nr:histone deacetylase family protein [Casimicrobiaceae bacterium]